MDIITLEEIEVKTLIGVYDYEQKMPQKLFISLSFGLNDQKAAGSDEIADTVDYGQVHQAIFAFADNHENKLLERFTHALCDKLMSEFSLPWLKMTVKKPNALRHCKGVSLTIERAL